MSLIDKFTKIVGVIAIILLILWFVEINPDLFRIFTPIAATPMETLQKTTIFLWSYRIVDTVTQGIIILTGLMGVLAYVLWGDEE